MSEEEQFFVFVWTLSQEGKEIIINDMSHYMCLYTPIKICRQRYYNRPQEGHQHHRISVDFDPLMENIAYVVVCNVVREYRNDDPQWCLIDPFVEGVFVDRQEAETTLRNVENGLLVNNSLRSKQKIIHSKLYQLNLSLY